MRRLPSLARGCASLMLAALAGAANAQALPDADTVMRQHPSSDVLVLDRHGEPLQAVRRNFQQRRDDWVPLAQVSPALQRAVILSEDHRFYSHGGVDWQAVAGAAWSRLTDGAMRGASTISMQLAGLLDDDLRRQTGGRTLLQKWDQAMQARVLESAWPKDRILEAYLNLAPFRGELIGVGAVARVMFGKQASGLDVRESALAAVMLRGPNASAHVLRQRACGLLQAMQRPELCEGLGWFVESVLRPTTDRMPAAPQIAPHAARQILATQPLLAGAQVYSTLDGELQRVAQDSIAQQMFLLRSASVHDAAVVVLDNRSGQVLAYVGASGQWSQAPEVDHARAPRQAGSTLKPFLYALALSEQRLTAASLLQDSPLSLPTGVGAYVPRNYDGSFAGWVSARTALAASLNIPAVRVLVMVGLDAFADLLLQLGLPLDRPPGHYGYSLALGSADLPLLELTNAYRTLANGGRYGNWSMRCGGNGAQPCHAAAGRNADSTAAASAGSDAGQDAAGSMETNAPAGTVQRYVADAMTGVQTAISPGAAWIVGDMLSDRQARVRTFGLDSPLSTPFWTAVKTGTSKDMRDNWAMGWSEHYTVGVWVGNSEGGSMRDVSGVSGAGPIWQDVMRYLHRHRGSHQPAPPATVQRNAIRFADALEPARTEVFLQGTAMTDIRLAAGDSSMSSSPEVAHQEASRDAGQDTSFAGMPAVFIVQPVHGDILALDPDIPAAHQRLRLRVSSTIDAAQAAGLRWMIGEQEIGQGPDASWLPMPGRHRIVLRDAAGRQLDVVTIQVRPPVR